MSYISWLLEHNIPPFLLRVPVRRIQPELPHRIRVPLTPTIHPHLACIIHHTTSQAERTAKRRTAQHENSHMKDEFTTPRPFIIVLILCLLQMPAQPRDEVYKRFREQGQGDEDLE
ncbi:hypothetical protein ACJBU6_10601 [Exserohilum turcicum]